ncbi:MAG: hypothetical protein LH654_12860 [Thermoleophilia bacterium]|nr:hypothetical protein [Thermoleophilia bacterium]
MEQPHALQAPPEPPAQTPLVVVPGCDGNWSRIDSDQHDTALPWRPVGKCVDREAGESVGAAPRLVGSKRMSDTGNARRIEKLPGREPRLLGCTPDREIATHDAEDGVLHLLRARSGYRFSMGTKSRSPAPV